MARADQDLYSSRGGAVLVRRAASLVPVLLPFVIRDSFRLCSFCFFSFFFLFFFLFFLSRFFFLFSPPFFFFFNVGGLRVSILRDPVPCPRLGPSSVCMDNMK